MKHYAFYEIKYPRRTRNNRELCIFAVKDNKLSFLGKKLYSTGATKGDLAEVLAFLVAIGEVPEKYLYSSGKLGDWIGNGYYAGEVTEYCDIQNITA